MRTLIDQEKRHAQSEIQGPGQKGLNAKWRPSTMAVFTLDDYRLSRLFRLYGQVLQKPN